MKKTKDKRFVLSGSDKHHATEQRMDRIRFKKMREDERTFSDDRMHPHLIEGGDYANS